MHRNGNASRRARRALAWAFAVFALAQAGVGLALDYVWPDVKFRSLADTLAALGKLPRSPDILCLGSSRMGTVFREQVVERELRERTGSDGLRVFNAAIEGSDLATADLTLERILAAGVRPAIVVVEISPETLAIRNRWLRHNVFRQWTWHDVGEKFADLLRSGGSRQLFETRLLPIYFYRFKILGEVCRRLCPASDRRLADEQAHVPREVRPDGTGVWWEAYMSQKRHEPTSPRERTQADLGLVRNWLKNYELGGSAEKALERLLERCRQHGVQVVLLDVPSCSAHRRLYTPQIEDAFQEHTRQLCRRYACQLVDGRARVPDELFQDNIHVLLEGGRAFSRELARDVLAPIWHAQFSAASDKLSRGPSQTPSAVRLESHE